MELLILGLDPGSTVGFAALNLDGELVTLDSVRNCDLAHAISKINPLGKIIVVGTDVTPVPKFVNKFASNFGAKIIEPKDDLLLKYKKKVTKEFLKNQDIKVKNKHELDALAAALAAFKHYKPLFNKIDNHLNQINKLYLKKNIKNSVLTNDVPIKKALEEYV